MSLPPGFPERGGFADQLQELRQRLEALERSERAPFTSVDGEITINGRPVDGVQVLTAANTGGSSPTSLTASDATLLTATFTIPSWVSSASVFATCGLTAYGLSIPLDARANIYTRIAGDDGETTTVDMGPGGEYRFAGTGHTRTVASPGSSLAVNLRGSQQLFTGSGIETSAFFVNAIAVLS